MSLSEPSPTRPDPPRPDPGAPAGGAPDDRTDLADRADLAGELARLRAEQGRLRIELQHRTRNMLSLIRAVVRRMGELSAAGEDGEDGEDAEVGTAQAYGARLGGRLDAIGRAHGAIARDPSAGVDLGMLIAGELFAYAAREGERVRLAGPRVLLRAEAAVSLTLAVHELAANAVQFGALGGPGGHVGVTWDLEPGEGDGVGRLVIAWRESGGPRLSAPTRQGFGTEVLTRTLAYELGAETDLVHAPDGLRCVLRLPLGERLLAG